MCFIIPVIPSSRWEPTALASFTAYPAARQKISGWNPHDPTSVWMDAYPIWHDISRRNSLYANLFKVRLMPIMFIKSRLFNASCIKWNHWDYISELAQHEAHLPWVDTSPIVGHEAQFVLESNAGGMDICRVESTRFTGIKMRNGSFTWTPTSDRIGSTSNFV